MGTGVVTVWSLGAGYGSLEFRLFPGSLGDPF